MSANINNLLGSSGVGLVGKPNLSTHLNLQQQPAATSDVTGGLSKALGVLGGAVNIASNAIGLAQIQDTSGIKSSIRSMGNEFAQNFDSFDALNNAINAYAPMQNVRAEDIRAYGGRIPTSKYTKNKLHTIRQYGMGGKVVGGTVNGAMAGASAGAAFGPWGAAAGAIIGGGASLIGGLIGNEKARNEASSLNGNIAEKDYQVGEWQNQAFNNIKRNQNALYLSKSFANGGNLFATGGNPDSPPLLPFSFDIKDIQAQNEELLEPKKETPPVATPKKEAPKNERFIFDEKPKEVPEESMQQWYDNKLIRDTKNDIFNWFNGRTAQLEENLQSMLTPYEQQAREYENNPNALGGVFTWDDYNAVKSALPTASEYLTNVKNRLNNATVNFSDNDYLGYLNNGEVGGRYNSNNTINIARGFLKNRPTALGHEFLHGMTSVDVLGSNPQIEKVRQILGEQGTKAKANGLDKSYINRANEIYSRMWELRKAAGLKPTDVIDDKFLKKIQKNNPSILNNLNLDFQDDGTTLIRLLNEVAQNDTPMNDTLNYAALGGILETNGADWSQGLMKINTGGTHEQNPYDGVQMGTDTNGTPNLVEEGETIYNDYVYSNRLKVPKELIEKYKFKDKDITFAEASKILAKESDETPNDPISQAGLEAFMSELAEAQETVREKKQIAKRKKAVKQLLNMGITPEMLAMNQQSNPEGEIDNTGYHGVPQDLSQYPQDEGIVPMSDPNQGLQGLQGLPNVNAYGGKLGNMFKGDGDESQVLSGITSLMTAVNANGELRENQPLFNAERELQNQSHLHAPTEGYTYDIDALLDSDEWKNAQFSDVNAKNKGKKMRYSKAEADYKKAKEMQDSQDYKDFTTFLKTLPKDHRYWKELSDKSGVSVEQLVASIQKDGADNFRLDNTLGWGHFTPKKIIKAGETIDRARPVGDNPLQAPIDKNKSGVENPTKPSITPLGQNGKYKPLPTFMKYAAPLGNMAGVIQSALTPADYSNANAIIEASNRAGNFERINFMPVADYLTYRPTDRLAAVNQIQAQSAGNARNIMNTSGGNRGQAMAGLAANNYTTNLGIGNAFMQSELANRQHEGQVIAHNAGINQFNSNGFLQSAQSNQNARQNAIATQLQGLTQGYGMREQIGQARANSIAKGLSNVYSDLTGIGKENTFLNMVNSNPANPGYIQRGNGTYDFIPQVITAFGGTIKRKKGRKNA